VTGPARSLTVSRVRRLTVLVVAVLALLGSAGPALAQTGDLTEAAGFYNDPDSPAAQAARAGLGRGATALSTVPQARWVTEQDGRSTVDRYVGGAARAGQYPVLVTYAVPNRDCGSYSAGGFRTLAQYKAWIDQVRAGIAGRPTVVVVEPDGLVGTTCLTGAALTDRYAAIRYAAATLGADPGTLVYLDGGHSRWLSTTELATRLRNVAAPTTRGFALNVSNFFTTAEEVGYGERVSALLGGARYLVDTSRNGAGPAPDAPLNWCNPTGRLLGALPTTSTGAPHADAYLWVKNPGQSDGSCDRGEPASGAWFTTWADDVVDRTLASFR
jgi:endoglucanase